jgi:hypothetical protein
VRPPSTFQVSLEIASPTRPFVSTATAKRTEIPFTPNCFLFLDEKLVWHGDPDPELEEHSGFRQAVRDALQKIDETI